jgi:transposase
VGKKDAVLNRQYTDEFKVEAVRLSESIGGSQAAKRLGIPDSSLWNWIRRSRAGKLKTPDGSAVPLKRSVTEFEAENRRLRRELASTKLDLEIVKKAAAYFAKESR